MKHPGKGLGRLSIYIKNKRHMQLRKKRLGKRVSDIGTEPSMTSDHGEAKSLVTCQVHHAEVQLVKGARPNRALSPLAVSIESLYCSRKPEIAFLYIPYHERPVM